MRRPHSRLRTLIIVIAFLALILTVLRQAVLLQRAAVREELYRAQAAQNQARAEAALAQAVQSQARADQALARYRAAVDPLSEQDPKR
jgi:hypothetical protein